MDRKKTILAAIFINAGLLVVLFIAALTTEEESAAQMAQLAQVQEPVASLFLEPIDLAVKPPPINEPSSMTQLGFSETPSVILPPLALETPAAAVVVTKTPDANFLEITVKKGENLDKIAKMHHTSVDELIKINQLPSSFLRVGQVLKIPSKTQTAAPVSKPKPVATENSSEFYTIKVGDNPWTIAMKHHMKVEELLKLNGLNEERARKLKPGDRLRIR